MMMMKLLFCYALSLAISTVCADDDKNRLDVELLTFPTYGVLLNAHSPPKSTKDEAVLRTYHAPIGVTAVGHESESDAVKFMQKVGKWFGKKQLQKDQVKYFFAEVLAKQTVVLDFTTTTLANTTNGDASMGGQGLQPDREIQVLNATEVNGKLISWNATHVVGITASDGFFQVNVTLEHRRPAGMGAEAIIKYQATLSEIGFKQPGEIYTVGPRGLSLVFDMDETLKYFGWTPKEAFNSMFYRPYRIIEGVNTTLNSWQQHAMPTQDDDYSPPVFFYESLSPWQLNPSLMNFVRSQGLPMGPFAIHKLPIDGFRPTPKNAKQILDFADVAGKKVESISRIFQQMSNRSYIMCGDTAMHDPEAYSEVINLFPQTHAVAAIRLIPEEKKNEPERFKKSFGGMNVQNHVLTFRSWFQLANLDVDKFILTGNLTTTSG